jgi:quercetin dioxygenase-like cupin family protein
MNNKKPPIATAPNEGKNISMIGNTYRILISGKQTDGAFAVIDMLIPPGGGPGPHAHTDFNESFYIVDGEIEIKSELGNYSASKGAFVSIPKGGVVHSFKNTTGKVAHLLCTLVPAGLEDFFEEMGQPVAFEEILPMPEINAEFIRQVQAAAEKHGQKVFPPDYLD